jgi:hypothetical protein
MAAVVTWGWAAWEAGPLAAGGEAGRGWAVAACRGSVWVTMLADGILNYTVTQR